MNYKLNTPYAFTGFLGFPSIMMITELVESRDKVAYRAKGEHIASDGWTSNCWVIRGWEDVREISIGQYKCLRTLYKAAHET